MQFILKAIYTKNKTMETKQISGHLKLGVGTENVFRDDEYILKLDCGVEGFKTLNLLKIVEFVHLTDESYGA